MGISHVINGLKAIAKVGKIRGQVNFDRYRAIMEQEVMRADAPGIADTVYGPDEIIVSLTSFGSRIDTVWLPIASMMRQTSPPNRIVLWLAEEEKSRNLPATLRRLAERGLEIRYCRDTRSYKKLLPALDAFPDAAVITIDDDVIYDFELIDRFIRAHAEDPDAIWGARVSKITFSADGKILPYKKWRTAAIDERSPLNIATGVGGILYPHRVFSSAVTHPEEFFSIVPTTDDLAFKALAIECGAEVRKMATRSRSGEDYIGGIVNFSDGLAGYNVRRGGNDLAVTKLSPWFDRLPRP